MTREERWIALDTEVIAVAILTVEVGDWAAYIGAVPGNNHEEEWHSVAKHGTKLNKDVAEVLFPSFKPYEWRY